MKNPVAHFALNGWSFICLLLPLSSLVNAQDCPTYPRAIDQIFVCLRSDNILKFEQNATLHNPVRFTFPELPPDVTIAFDYDANDNDPIVEIGSGEIKTVTYPAPGQYQLYWVVQWISGYETDPLGNPVPIISSNTGYFTFQTNFNSDVNYGDYADANHWGDNDFEVPAYTPPPSNAYPSGSPYNNATTAGGIVHILYANPDHLLRKPFIFVEGFDPIVGPSNEYAVNTASGNATLGYGRVRWDVIVTGRDEEYDPNPSEPGVPHTNRFALWPTLIDQLLAKGYDFIYVDFADAGNYIQANADFLIEVIEKINNEKITSEENVLMGASMGGIISRYALAKLEAQGKSHCTGLFFTLDTPHNGANIPLPLQALGWIFHAIGKTDDAWIANETPAARQQLINHFGTAIQSGAVEIKNIPIYIPQLPNSPFTTDLSFSELNSADYSILRNQLKGELNGLGWPELPRKVALSDGMKNGTLPSGQGFSPGQQFFDATGYAEGADFGTVFKMALRASNGGGPESYTLHGIPGDCSGKWNFPLSPETGNILLKMGLPSDLNPCPLAGDVPYKYYNITLESKSELPFLDNAPGGFRTDMRAVTALLKPIIEGGGATFHNPVNFPVITFAPTWSGLAMGTDLTNTNLFVDLTTSEFFEENLPNVKIPHFDFFIHLQPVFVM